jgi:hypothetical protein
MRTKKRNSKKTKNRKRKSGGAITTIDLYENLQKKFTKIQKENLKLKQDLDKIQTFFDFRMNVDLSPIFSANYDEHGMLVDENGNELGDNLIDDLIYEGWCMPGSIATKGPYSEEFTEWWIGYTRRHPLMMGAMQGYRSRGAAGSFARLVVSRQQELLKREHAYQLSLKNESNDDYSSDVEVVDVVTPQDKENIARATAIEID